MSKLKGALGSFKVKISNKRIFIDFKPNKDINCKKIVLTQVVKVSSDNKMIKPSLISQENFGHLDDDITDNGFVVDHGRCEKDPYYNGDDPHDKGPHRQQGKVDGNKIVPSKMDDRPRLFLLDDTNETRADFEVCALCTENDMDGSYFGCIKWSYARKDATETVELVSDNVFDSPSNNFLDAVKKFDGNHRNELGGRICPDGQIFNIVQGDRYMKMKGIDLFYCANFSRTILKLTYLGPQLKPIPTLVIAAAEKIPSMKKFEKFEDDKFDYSNDRSILWFLSVTNEEMHELLAGLANTKTLFKRTKKPELSFMILNDSEITRNYHEILVDKTDIPNLLNILREHLRHNNEKGKEMLLRYMTVLGLSKDNTMNVKPQFNKLLGLHHLFFKYFQYYPVCMSLEEFYDEYHYLLGIAKKEGLHAEHASLIDAFQKIKELQRIGTGKTDVDYMGAWYDYYEISKRIKKYDSR